MPPCSTTHAPGSDSEEELTCRSRLRRDGHRRDDNRYANHLRHRLHCRLHDGLYSGLRRDRERGRRRAGIEHQLRGNLAHGWAAGQGGKHGLGFA